MEMLRLSMLGGLLGLDGTSVGQFMVSRPLVAGALTGWLSGDVSTGIAIGAILELYLLVSFPTGGSRFPEASTATVVAVGAAAPFPEVGALPIAVALGLVWGHLGGASVTLQRQLNTRLVPAPGSTSSGGPAPRGVTLRTVAVRHALAVTIDFFRGAGVTAAGVAVGWVVMGVVAPTWPLDAALSHGIVMLGGAVSAGILLHDMGGFRKRRVWLAAGVAVGVVGARFL
jgi:mannose/fructose/N-acetylgalactosamine-specific phosphotransferase system component IIC